MIGRTSGRRGQLSMELLLTVGMVIAFTIPVVLLLFSLSQAGVERSAWVQAEGGAHQLADGINEIYTEGAGAKRTIYLNLPPTTRKVVLANHEVTVVLDSSVGEYDAVAPVFGAMEDRELSVRGLAIIQLEVNGENQVVVNA